MMQNNVRVFRNVILRILTTLAAVSFMLISNGCEDVIDLPLRNVAPQLVIEGHLSENLSWSYFQLSQTTDFYRPTEVAPVSGAQIIITDTSGRADTLNESSTTPGYYPFRTLTVQSNQLYTARVTVNGATYTAQTTCQPFIRLDSLTTEFQAGGGIGLEEDEGYRLHVFFNDSVGIPTYTRVVPYRNNRRLGDIYLYDGRFSDGNLIDYEYFLKVFQLGDTVLVDLFTLDREMYDYYTTLAEVLAYEEGQGGFEDVTPANPNSNWSGGALGYFGAFRVSRRTIVVE